MSFRQQKKKREQIIINGFYNYLVFNGLCVPKKKLYFGPNKSKTQDLGRHILSTIPGGGWAVVRWGGGSLLYFSSFPI